jgi:peptidoglycan/LPS O-acetylase OafA/YrhL
VASAGDPVGAVRGSPQLLSIQILRAVAALAVLTHHTLFEISFYTSGRGVAQDILVGAAGVDLFFVISGFVMVYSSEPLFGRSDAPRVFLLRRLVRIVPLYWAVSGIILAYVLITYRGLIDIYSVGSVIASFAFVPYPGPGPGGLMQPIHGLGWTLNYEMFFYAVFTAAIVLPRRAAVLAVTAVFLVLVAIGRARPLPQPLAFWSQPIILEFCLGMIIAQAYRAGVRWPRRVSWAVGIAAIAAFATSARGVSWSGALASLVEWGVPAAALVAACTLSRDTVPPGPVARCFGFLGDVSYSLYLVHPLVVAGARRTIAHWIDFSGFPWAYAPLIFFGSIAAAVVSYLAFEKPITRALQRRIRKPAAADR